ncbi:hypothetical protein BD289DRAFT_480112 [Coniella lustricola]|uniref:Uncharacterized protein n=1 Tax=Coniella lustricola TaxID=2025994 RepID=A0A2T3AGS5_9PEZI|nr:hypothetical protein BD289DRAFT_480112 [Coniella lustricola]
MSSTSRFLRNCDSHARDVTSLVPRKRRVPDYQLGDFRSKLSTTIVELTGRLNDKFKNIDHDVDQHIETIADLKHRIKKQQGEMSRHKKQTMGKDAAIHRLEEEQDRLMERLHNAEQELEVRSARVSKLEEKGKSYKRFLNSAVAEQQELYKVTKSKCEAAICELKAQETRRRALQEQERTQAEAAREKLNGMVKATVAEFRSKEQEYDNKIEALTQIVRQRDEDILRERATAQSLLKQNSSISKVHEALKDFGARMDDAVLKFDHFTSSAPTQDSYIGAETCARIDRIMDLLQDRFDRGTTPASLPNHIQEQIEKAVNSILNKLQPLSDSQHSTHEILSLLLSSLENFASDIWDVIEELQDTIEEYWSQRQDKTLQEQIDSLTTRIRDKETECNSCSQLLLASNETAREQRNLIDQLRNEIMDLEHAQAESFQQSEQLQLLRNDCEKWRQDAAMKANLVSDLEHKLQEAESAMLRNSSTREGEIEDLRKHLLRKVEKSRVARRQAVEATRQGAIIRMGKVKAEFDKRLAQALEERLALQSAVAAAKQKMQNIETETVRNSDKVSNLEAELQTVQDQSVRDRKESQQKEAKQDTILQQQVNHINDLQIQLDSSEAKFKNLADHVLAYDKAAQLVLRNLKQWTKGYGAIQKLASTSTKLENKKLAQIDPKFKPLIQLQMLQKAVIEHCETQAERRGHTKIDIGEALATTETKARRSSWPTLSTTGIKQVSNVLAGSLFGPLRRVTIRSPISNAPSPQPLSIRAEQERRRLTEAPRSIMKVATLSQIQLLDDGTPQEDLAQEQEEPFQKGNNVTQTGGRKQSKPSTL